MVEVSDGNDVNSCLCKKLLKINFKDKAKLKNKIFKNLIPFENDTFFFRMKHVVPLYKTLDLCICHTKNPLFKVKQQSQERLGSLEDEP